MHLTSLLGGYYQKASFECVNSLGHPLPWLLYMIIHSYWVVDDACTKNQHLTQPSMDICGILKTKSECRLG